MIYDFSIEIPEQKNDNMVCSDSLDGLEKQISIWP